MEPFILDLFKAHLTVAAGYCLYKAILASQPGFQANRFILLTIGLVAMSLPFWPSMPGSSQWAVIAVDLPEFVISDHQAKSSHIPWFTIFLSVYGLITIFLLVRTISQIFYLVMIGKGKSLGGVRIVETNKVKSSSFFKRIFIDPNMDVKIREVVIAHEKVHAKQWHTLDTLLFELLSAAFWINPAVWYLKRELRETHEFIADAETKNQFSSQEYYVNALLNQTFQTHSVMFIPTFNHSQTLKNRIIMITSKKSVVRMRYLLFLPVMAGIVITAACTKQSETENSPPTQKDNLPVVKEGDVYSVVETMPEYPGGTEALFSYLGNHINYPEAAKNSEIEGVVHVRFVIDHKGQITNSEVVKGIGGGCDEEALRVVRSMPNWSPGMQDGKPVKVEFNLPIRFALK